MKYLLLIYEDEEVLANQPEDSVQADLLAYYEVDTEAKRRGIFAASEALQPSSETTNIRVRYGKTIKTSGPFVPAREQVAGFFLLDCKDLDEAIEMAIALPGAKSGRIEIRPAFNLQ